MEFGSFGTKFVCKKGKKWLGIVRLPTNAKMFLAVSYESTIPAPVVVVEMKRLMENKELLDIDPDKKEEPFYTNNVHQLFEHKPETGNTKNEID